MCLSTNAIMLTAIQVRLYFQSIKKLDSDIGKMRIACFKGLLQLVHSCFMKLLKVFSYYFYLLCLGLEGDICLKLHLETSVKRYLYRDI